MHPNQFKYIKAPTWGQVEKVVDAHGVTIKQFERFYGICYDLLSKIRRGEKQLPVKHWHIVYECLKMIEENRPLPVFREDIPKPAESPLSKFNIPFFSKPKKKKSKKRKTIKRTGTLCELC